MIVRALQAFVVRDADTGSLTSVQCGATITTDNTFGTKLIADGLAESVTTVEPTGKKTIDSTAEVDVSLYASAQVVDANLVAGNIKKDVNILGEIGTYEGGGGGSSDFSTCTVTITNEVGAGHEYVSVGIPNTYDSETPDDPDDPTASYGYMSISNDRSYTIDCILYKGKATAVLEDVEVKFTVVSGDAVAEGGYALISGDCTLKIEFGGLS